jgi:hypothetical protein
VPGFGAAMTAAMSRTVGTHHSGTAAGPPGWKVGPTAEIALGTDRRTTSEERGNERSGSRWGV